MISDWEPTPCFGDSEHGLAYWVSVDIFVSTESSLLALDRVQVALDPFRRELPYQVQNVPVFVCNLITFI